MTTLSADQCPKRCIATTRFEIAAIENLNLPPAISSQQVEIRISRDARELVQILFFVPYRAPFRKYSGMVPATGKLLRILRSTAAYRVVVQPPPESPAIWISLYWF